MTQPPPDLGPLRRLVEACEAWRESKEWASQNPAKMLSSVMTSDEAAEVMREYFDKEAAALAAIPDATRTLAALSERRDYERTVLEPAARLIAAIPLSERPGDTPVIFVGDTPVPTPPRPAPTGGEVAAEDKERARAFCMAWDGVYTRWGDLDDRVAALFAEHRLALATAQAAQREAEGRLVSLEEEVQRHHRLYVEAMGHCSIDYTDFSMARLGAEGWRIRAEQAESDLVAERQRADAAEDLLANERAQSKGFSDRIVELKGKLDAAEGEMGRMKTALDWYAEQASAMRRYMDAKPPMADAMTAVAHALALDNGTRALPPTGGARAGEEGRDG